MDFSCVQIFCAVTNSTEIAWTHGKSADTLIHLGLHGHGLLLSQSTDSMSSTVKSE